MCGVWQVMCPEKQGHLSLASLCSFIHCSVDLRQMGRPFHGCEGHVQTEDQMLRARAGGSRGALGTPKAGSPHPILCLRAAIGLGKKTSPSPTTETGSISPQPQGKTWPLASSRQDSSVSPVPWRTAVESPLCPTTGNKATFPDCRVPRPLWLPPRSVRWPAHLCP